jgi:hypothetical protein
MSKERDLLKRAMHVNGDLFYADICLYKEIQELLAQPEQEPVAWITEWVQRYRLNDTPIIDRAVSFTKGGAPAVPNPNYIPLYTSPTREHLSQVVDSDEMASAYLGARLWEFINIAGNFPKAKPDLRIWDHVMVYAPKQEPMTGKERNLLERALRAIEPYASDYEAYELIDKIGELLAQPEQEPMTGKEISQGFKADKDATNAESYWAGVALAEKHYGVKRNETL